jgi:hypothetical protein
LLSQKNCSRKPSELRSLIDSGKSDLSVRQQCVLLVLTLSSYYREPQRESEENQKLMRRIHELLSAETTWGQPHNPQPAAL